MPFKKKKNCDCILDFLTIESLLGVQINDVDSLRAIGFLCPHLTLVSFEQVLRFPEINALNPVKSEEEGLLSTEEELESILKGWPKVNLRLKYCNLIKNVHQH